MINEQPAKGLFCADSPCMILSDMIAIVMLYYIKLSIMGDERLWYLFRAIKLTEYTGSAGRSCGASARHSSCGMAPCEEPRVRTVTNNTEVVVMEHRKLLITTLKKNIKESELVATTLVKSLNFTNMQPSSVREDLLIGDQNIFEAGCKRHERASKRLQNG